MSLLVCAHACICLSSWSQLWFTIGNDLQVWISSCPNIFISKYLYVRISSCSKTHVRAPSVVNDFTDPNLVLNQNHFIAQVNTLYTNAVVTRANQLWIRGFANASSQLLFSRIFCSWMYENRLSPENREGRRRMHWSFRVMRQCCSVSNYMVSHMVAAWGCVCLVGFLLGERS